MKLERIIYFTPAYDKRPKAPGDPNYGIHGVTMSWYVTGGGQAVQFVTHTNWQLPEVQEELDAKVSLQFPHLSCHPLPTDVGYHSSQPLYKGQTPIEADCKWTKGPCYYNGSSLYAQNIFEILVREGHEAVWKKLEEEFWNAWPELVVAPD